MASWNSSYMEVLYYVLGWISFCAWAICFYPQVILNFKRKSVLGLNFDFAALNFTKHTCYLVYNASLFFSSTVQRQYRQKYGFDQMMPVAANDVAFSIHAVLLTALTLFQIAIYDRGNQKLSKSTIAIISTAMFSAAICVFVAMPSHSWLWLVSCFNTLQVVMTTIKYIPQAFFNFQRKSTIGFSIGYVLLDFVGSTTSFCQMTVESIDQSEFFNPKHGYTNQKSNTWIFLRGERYPKLYLVSNYFTLFSGSFVNFYGNVGKILLSLVSLIFDTLFMLQHFVLYRFKDMATSPTNAEDKASLLETSDLHSLPHPDHV